MLVLCPKESISQVHLSEDASHRPHVNLGTVGLVVIVEKDLWCSEPSSHYIRGKLIVVIDLRVDNSCQAKVTDFHCEFVIN